MMFRGAQGKNPYVSTTDPAFLNRAELFMRCFPCDTGISLLLGITYHDYGDTTRAIRKLRYALTVTNATPIAHLYLASAYFKRKDYRNCIVHYEVASRLEPSIRTRAVFTQHKEAVADAYCHIGNIAMATTLYNEYFREYPGDARALRRARLCSVKIRK
jgi:tetratricopeptide (TPR) repeat protein